MSAPQPTGTDGLTGLPDRDSTLSRARSLKEQSAAAVNVIVVGVDRLGRINESFGPSVGDAVLLEVARRLGNLVRDGDVFGRLSGSEFLVVSASGDAASNGLARRLADVGHAAIVADGTEVFATTIVGHTTCEPQGTMDDAVRNARAALHQSPRHTGDATPFDGQADQDLTEAALMRHELSLAVDADQLVLHFQPCVDLADGSIRGAEALVRWQHPRLGLLEPGQFIAQAEDTGVIAAIDAWALETSCRYLAEWGALVDLTAFHVSVNVSAKRFNDPSLERATRRAIGRHHIPARAVWIELTETEAMNDSTMNLASMAALRELGVRFLLDDFGTGHSSLEYLQRFPIDAVKIDRTFTAGVGTHAREDAIVASILELAATLELDVIAEGVETTVQRDWLRAHGCRLAQGTLYSAPVPAEAFHDLLIRAQPLSSG